MNCPECNRVLDIASTRSPFHYTCDKCMIGFSSSDFEHTTTDLCAHRKEVERLQEVVRILRNALVNFQIFHSHAKEYLRMLGESYGWCSVCSEKVEVNEDFARDALDKADKVIRGET